MKNLKLYEKRIKRKKLASCGGGSLEGCLHKWRSRVLGPTQCGCIIRSICVEDERQKETSIIIIGLVGKKCGTEDYR